MHRERDDMVILVRTVAHVHLQLGLSILATPT